MKNKILKNNFVIFEFIDQFSLEKFSNHEQTLCWTYKCIFTLCKLL